MMVVILFNNKIKKLRNQFIISLKQITVVFSKSMKKIKKH